MIHDFAPRRIGEILDDAITLVRANWRSVLALSAVVLLPAAAAYSVVASFYLRSFLELIGTDVKAAAAGGAPAQPGTFILLIAVLMQGLGLVYLLAKAVFDAGLFSQSAQLLERRSVPVKDALRAGFKAFVPLVAVQMIVGAGGGLVAAVVGIAVGILSIFVVALSPVVGAVGILLAYALAGAAYLTVAVLLAIAYPIVVIEGGIGTALTRSVKLVRRHFWRVLFIILGAGIVATQFESALAAPTLIREIVTGAQQPGALLGQIGWGWKVFDGLIQGLAIAVVLPFGSSVTLLTYLDLRARDEGMDLLVRARELLPA
jgi:hypothetical protein